MQPRLTPTLSAVERIVEYTELPLEAPAVIANHRPPAFWPSSRGPSDLIVVDDLTVRYAPELPAVLRSVTFSLHGNERVGVVGRTGSGKSTLVMSLLRFVGETFGSSSVCLDLSQVEPDAGCVTIDGLDIGDIGLFDLRSRIVSPIEFTSRFNS